MAAFCLETSCILAYLSERDHRHAETVIGVEQRLAQKQEMIVVAHSLLEAFSGLTGMPHPRRVRPRDARSVLRKEIADRARVVNLETDVFEVMAHLEARGRSGGAIYDASIAMAAFAAGASEILTWNVKDFLALSPAGLKVVTPSTSATSSHSST